MSTRGHILIRPPARPPVTLSFTQPQLDTLADLVDIRLSLMTVTDREEERVARVLRQLHEMFARVSPDTRRRSLVPPASARVA